MPTRTTTSATTVPAGSSTSGKVSGVANSDRLRVDSGDKFTDHLKSGDEFYKWIYLEATEELARVRGIIGDDLVRLDREVTASNSDWQVVKADLESYSISEQDGNGGTATVNGATLSANQIVNASRGNVAGDGVSRQLDPATVNGNGTTLRIVEQLAGG